MSAPKILGFSNHVPNYVVGPPLYAAPKPAGVSHRTQRASADTGSAPVRDQFQCQVLKGNSKEAGLLVGTICLKPSDPVTLEIPFTKKVSHWIFWQRLDVQTPRLEGTVQSIGTESRDQNGSTQVLGKFRVLFETEKDQENTETLINRQYSTQGDYTVSGIYTPHIFGAEPKLIGLEITILSPNATVPIRK